MHKIGIIQDNVKTSSYIVSICLLNQYFSEPHVTGYLLFHLWTRL